MNNSLSKCSIEDAVGGAWLGLRFGVDPVQPLRIRSRIGGAGKMRSYRGARDAVNEIIEGPDEDLYRIVRSVHDNGWKVSGKLTADFPILEDKEVADRIVEAVREAFKAP